MTRGHESLCWCNDCWPSGAPEPTPLTTDEPVEAVTPSARRYPEEDATTFATDTVPSRSMPAQTSTSPGPHQNGDIAGDGPFPWEPQPEPSRGSTEWWSFLMKEIYVRYNPAKLDQFQDLRNKYVGREQQWFNAFRENTTGSQTQ